MQELDVASVICRRHIRIADQTGWPDGIVQEIVFDKAIELILTDPNEEAEDISRIFFTEISEILFLAFFIPFVENTALLIITLEVSNLKS